MEPGWRGPGIGKEGQVLGPGWRGTRSLMGWKGHRIEKEEGMLRLESRESQGL